MPYLNHGHQVNLPTVKLHLQESNCKYSFPIQALKVMLQATSALAQMFAYVHVFNHLSAYSPIKIWIHTLSTTFKDGVTSKKELCSLLLNLLVEPL